MVSCATVSPLNPHLPPTPQTSSSAIHVSKRTVTPSHSSFFFDLTKPINQINLKSSSSPSSSMAGWASNNNQKPSIGVIMNGHDAVWKQPKFSQKPCMELMQNCDLPPPQKVFSGFCGVMMGREDVDDGSEYEKLELLKALRLSQTRAREAERRAESLAKERDLIASVLMKESLELFACRQWVKLLEVQVLMLQPHHRQKRQQEKEMEEGDDDDGGGGEGISWIVALAICLGIAGVGLAFSCRCIGFNSTCL